MPVGRPIRHGQVACGTVSVQGLLGQVHLHPHPQPHRPRAARNRTTRGQPRVELVPWVGASSVLSLSPVLEMKMTSSFAGLVELVFSVSTW